MTKIISISDEAYEELRKIKNGLSFSMAILTLTRMKKRDSIMDFAGTITKEEGEKILNEIKKEREKISRRVA